MATDGELLTALVSSIFNITCYLQDGINNQIFIWTKYHLIILPVRNRSLRSLVHETLAKMAEDREKAATQA